MIAMRGRRERPIAEPEHPVPEAPSRGAVEPPTRSVEAAPTVTSARADAPVPKPGSLDRLRRDSGAGSGTRIGVRAGSELTVVAARRIGTAHRWTAYG
jgi:hypothetical protein